MKWGFIGTGTMANRMAEAFGLVESASLVSAWSRRPEQVREFCDRWQVPKACSTLDELLEDGELDAVYVVTPHLVHCEHVMKALGMGKHVLCEKPMAMSEEETRKMAGLARERGLFLMEAYWTRFFPAMERLSELLCGGSLGKVRHVSAEFGINIPYNSESRFYSKALGGGSMRGAGIYPMGFACTAFNGLPERMKASAYLKNGVDVRGGALLTFEGGGTAMVETGYDGGNTRSGSVTCDAGCVTVPHLIMPDEINIITEKGTETVMAPFQEPGLQYELLEAEKCIAAGKQESDIMPLDLSIGLARVFDEYYGQLMKEEQ